MPNRLQFEKSEYLLQHKDNPVDWYPWGNDAFQKAKEFLTNKLNISDDVNNPNLIFFHSILP